MCNTFLWILEVYAIYWFMTVLTVTSLRDEYMPPPPPPTFMTTDYIQYTSRLNVGFLLVFFFFLFFYKFSTVVFIYLFFMLADVRILIFVLYFVFTISFLDDEPVNIFTLSYCLIHIQYCKYLSSIRITVIVITLFNLSYSIL